MNPENGLSGFNKFQSGLTVDLPRTPGSYCLLFRIDESKSIQIGKLGLFKFYPSFYFYVGSAKGPGGLKARINRHLEIHKNMFWHIDYFRSQATLIGYFYSFKLNKECEWAHNLSNLKDIEIPVKKFGASDCKNQCGTHLFMVRNLHKYSISEFILDSKCEFSTFMLV